MKEKQIIETENGFIDGGSTVIGGTGPHWDIPPYGGNHGYTERGI